MDMGDHDDWWWDIAEQLGLKHRIDDNGVENESLDQWKAAGINLYFRLR
jgi:hypothetical protein